MISRRIFAAVALLCAFVAPAYAQKTKTALTTEINTNWPDNVAGAITPAILRSTVIDIVNSYYDLAGGTSLACAAHQWVSGLPTLSSLTCAQPGFSDLSGSISPTQIPAPTATTLGGIESITLLAHNWVSYIDTAGLPHQSQPAFGDISGQAALTQLPTIGANTALCSVAGGTPIACTQAQLTSLINPATASLSGALPAWPNNTTSYFRGDGSYQPLNFAAIGGNAAATQGGTGVTSPTSNAILKAQGASPMVASALTDNGVVVSSSESIDTTSNAHVQEIANAGTTGTTVNKLAKLTGAPSTAVIATTTDTTGNVIGIVTGGAGTTGNAQIAITGQASCVFDGAITSGHYAQVSTTTGGDCHDGGATFPTSGQILGVIIAATNASPGSTPQAVTLFAPGTVGVSASSSGTVTNVATGNGVTGGPITTTGTISADPTFFPNYIGGLRLSNDSSSPNIVLDISAGAGTDSTNTSLIKLGAFTKSTAGTWTAGSGNNGMASGLTVAANTWYSVFLVNVSGTPDVYFDTPKVTATTPPAGTTAYRHLGWFKTDGSSHIYPMSCVDDTCQWGVYQGNLSTGLSEYNVSNPCNGGSSGPGSQVICATTLTLPNIPPGPVTAILNTDIANISVPVCAINWYLKSPAAMLTTVAQGGSNSIGGAPESGSEPTTVMGTIPEQLQIQTDSFGRVFSTVSSCAAGTGTGASQFFMTAVGWIYHRTPPTPPVAAIATPTVVGTLGSASGTFTSTTFTTSAALVQGNTANVCILLDATNSVTVSNYFDGVNTYYPIKRVAPTAGVDLELWTATNVMPVAASSTVTITLSGTTGASSSITAIMSQNANTPVGAAVQLQSAPGIVADQAASGSSLVTSATATTSALSYNNELALGCSSSFAGTYTEPSGFTNVGTAVGAGGASLWMDYEKLAAVTAVSYAPSWSGTSSKGAVVGTFKGN